MSDVMYLWKETAPYSEFSPEQAQPSLTPFPVSGSKGAVVVIPGGAYCMKADHEGAPIARMLNDAGVSAYVLDYRVRPCHKLAPLADANRAIRLVRSLGYEKVAILGFSAGGNLCCNAATHYDLGNPDSDDPIERCSSRPDGFIPCYAVVSMISYTHKGSVQNLLGDEQNKDSELRYFSGELNVTDDTPTAFIWHTAADSAVPVENSLALAKALSDHRVPFELHVFPKGAHGLGLAEGNPSVRQWAKLLQNWLVLGGYAQ